MISYVKISNRIASKNRISIDVPVEEQRRFIEALPRPIDLIGRSYAQYACWRFFQSASYRLLLNVCASGVLPVLLVLYGLKKKPRKTREVTSLIDMLPEDFLAKSVPNSLINESILAVSWNHGCLRNDDVRLVLRMWRRYPFAFYFVLKCMVKIACYRYAAECYQPQSIIVHNEYSFTSSVLTEWCRRNGICHINFMHGERLYNIRSSFFEYDKCYVWDLHYKKLYEKMHAAPGQFVIEIPDSLNLHLEKYIDSFCFADFKYILAIYSERELQDIVRSVHRLKDRGYSVRFRPHPRYSNMDLLRKYVSEGEIEYATQVSIERSIANAGCVIGSYSTVLLQAYLSGVKVALDDVTYKERCEELRKRDYILAEKNDILRFSQLIA